MILGQVISIFGAALLRFALSLYILDITGRADMFAVLYAISNIPILLSPLGGAIADRFNRRNLMVIFDFTSGSVVMCLFLLISSESTTVTLIGVIMVLLSIISALYTPAVIASIPLLVEIENLREQMVLYKQYRLYRVLPRRFWAACYTVHWGFAFSLS